MNAWTVFDSVFFGPSPPVSIESKFSLDVTTTRLLSLTQPDSPDDLTMPELSITVTGEDVLAWYREWEQSRGGYVSGIVGLVFRGRLHADEGVRLTGSFGPDDATRFLGVCALLLATVLTFASFVPNVGSLGLFGWAIPIFFVVTAQNTRMNGDDDMRLITNNLVYALRGDDDTT